MRIGQGITLTEKNTRKAAAIFKREESGKQISYTSLRSCIKYVDSKFHDYQARRFTVLAPSTLTRGNLKALRQTETHTEKLPTIIVVGKCAAADRYNIKYL